ncbi:MAG: hypothetical protein AAF631_13580, partial [Pseudomonadota bacterium]
LQSDSQAFDQFITAPWPVAARDNLGETPLDSPIELWSRKMRSYLALMGAAENVLHIRYEDLLSDFTAQMDRIADYIPVVGGGYGAVNRSVKASDNLRLEDYQRRYKYHKLKTDFKKRDLEYIYRKVDDDVMEALGYRKVL